MMNGNDKRPHGQYDRVQSIKTGRHKRGVYSKIHRIPAVAEDPLVLEAGFLLGNSYPERGPEAETPDKKKSEAEHPQD